MSGVNKLDEGISVKIGCLIGRAYSPTALETGITLCSTT